MEDLANVNPQDYYHSLTRKERGQFLRYLVGRLGMNYSTVSSKLGGFIDMKQQDVVLFNLAIQKEREWRK